MDFKTVGRYEVVASIGRGAMGEVYKAFDPVLKRHVAIKMLTAQLGVDTEMRKRFEREAQSAARLNHQNIVTVYQLGEEQGTIYIAMELLEGRDLKEMIHELAARPLDERLRIVDQVFAGVAFAHEHGVVHRDLKPANIRVLPSGQVKVVDFGLARLQTNTSDMTQAGMILGTPNYMSPEQVQGERADAASDVFALGAVCYEVLTGKRAFAGDSLHTILGKVLTDDPPAPRTLAPDISEPLQKVVHAAMAKERTERYQNASELRAALHAAVPSMAGGRRRRASELTAPMVIPMGSGAAAARVAEPQPYDAPTLNEPVPTMLASARTKSPGASASSGARSPMGLAAIGGAVLLVAGIGGVVVWKARSTPAPAGPAPAAAQESFERVLREQLIESQVQLARVSLDNKEYDEAIQKAEEALKEDPQAEGARDIVQKAQTAIRERDAAAEDARQALVRKDMGAASHALARLLAVDPRHPAVPELSTALNATFRDQAQSSRALAVAARTEAVGQQASAAVEGFSRGESLLSDGDGFVERQEYAGAAQKFAEARDAFGKAQRAALAEAAVRREAEAKRAAAQRASEKAAAEAAKREAATAPPTAAPAAPVVAPPVAVAAAPGAPAADVAIRRVLAEYERAVEAKDIALFRTVKPNLSGDEQKRLEDGFKAIKSQDVGLTIEAIDVSGAKATVRTSRRDTMNGKLMPMAVSQVFRLSQTADGWKIDSIGQ